jgi:hypothetical protein
MVMKIVELTARVDAQKTGKDVGIKLEIEREIGIELCMALLLLKESLSDAIELKFQNFSLIFRLSGNQYSYCESIDVQKSVFKGRIALNAVDYVMHYILKFYRDEIAEAEHIDLAFESDKGLECTWIIKCKRYRELSADEVKRILK